MSNQGLKLFSKENFETIKKNIENLYYKIIEIFDDISNTNIPLPMELKKRNDKYNDYILKEWEKLFGELRFFMIINEELLNKIKVCSTYYNLIKGKKKFINDDLKLILTK